MVMDFSWLDTNLIADTMKNAGGLSQAQPKGFFGNLLDKSMTALSDPNVRNLGQDLAASISPDNQTIQMMTGAGKTFDRNRQFQKAAVKQSQQGGDYFDRLVKAAGGMTGPDSDKSIPSKVTIDGQKGTIKTEMPFKSQVAEDLNQTLGSNQPLEAMTNRGNTSAGSYVDQLGSNNVGRDIGELFPTRPSRG